MANIESIKQKYSNWMQGHFKIFVIPIYIKLATLI